MRFILSFLSCLAFVLTPNFAFSSNQVGTPKVAGNVIDLDIRLDVNGSLVTHPQAHVKMGEKASITQMAVDGASSYTIEVTPQKDSKGMIDLNFAIMRWNQGKTSVLSTPQLKMMMGRTSRMEVKVKDQSRLMLTVSTLR
jgi:hypothetical protein